ERQDRRALSERRLWEGLSQGSQGWPRREGRLDDHRGGRLRGHRSDHRHAYRQDEVVKRRRIRRYYWAEVRGAGHKEDGGDRLEPTSLPQQYHRLSRRGHEARRI